MAESNFIYLISEIEDRQIKAVLLNLHQRLALREAESEVAAKFGSFIRWFGPIAVAIAISIFHEVA